VFWVFKVYVLICILFDFLHRGNKVLVEKLEPKAILAGRCSRSSSAVECAVYMCVYEFV